MRRLKSLILTFLLLAKPVWAEDVGVFAAASLTNAMTEIGEQFMAKTGHKIVSSFAASSTLAKQIEQGAPAQLFASADLKWVDYLASKKLINPETRFNLLGNNLVLIAPQDSQLGKLEITEKTDIVALLGDGRLATGNPDSVPVGLYFRQVMEKSGQWAKMEGKIARADSVRAALVLVERGEVPLGVVYATDAAISSKVKVLGEFPAFLHEPIVYPFALIAGKENKAGLAFLDYLRDSSAKAVFLKYGFKLN